MRARLKTAALGLSVIGASVLVSPLFDRIAVPKEKPAVAIHKEADISKKLGSNDRQEKLDGAWKIAEIPWKKSVSMQIDSAVEPLLRNIGDKDPEIRMVSAMALRSIAENKKMRQLSEGMPLIHDALEKETDNVAKEEMKLLISRMRQSQKRPGSFY